MYSRPAAPIIETSTRVLSGAAFSASLAATAAKRAREQAVKERRLRKQEKKAAAAERRALGLPPLYLEETVDVEETVDADPSGE
jgi:hypothetical protein